MLFDDASIPSILAVAIFGVGICGILALVARCRPTSDAAAALPILGAAALALLAPAAAVLANWVTRGRGQLALTEVALFLVILGVGGLHGWRGTRR